MTAPAQIAFSADGKRAGIRAHGRVHWLPDDFTAPMQALQRIFDRLNASDAEYAALLEQAERMALKEISPGAR